MIEIEHTIGIPVPGGVAVSTIPSSSLYKFNVDPHGGNTGISTNVIRTSQNDTQYLSRVSAGMFLSSTDTRKLKHLLAQSASFANLGDLQFLCKIDSRFLAIVYDAPLKIAIIPNDQTINLLLYTLLI